MDARRTITMLAAVLVLGAARGATAQVAAAGGNGFGPDPSISPFTPAVPVSAFARPASWFDPSRLHFTTTVSFGTGWGGASEGMQVTSLRYQVANPLAVKVSVGNLFGQSAAMNGSSMFLEGLQVAYRPHPSFQINVDYRNIRSPLQYSYYSGFGPFGR